MSKLIKDAYHEWIDESFMTGNALCLTLNFKQRHETEGLTQRIASDTIRRFKHALCRKAFGCRKAGRLTGEYDLNFVAVFEGKANREDGTALHCHALLGVPSGTTVDAWRALCEEQWKKLDWADPKNCRFDDFKSSGYITYILKNRTKENWEQAIDTQTLRLAPSNAPVTGR